jgi:hypothetical protein
MCVLWMFSIWSCTRLKLCASVLTAVRPARLPARHECSMSWHQVCSKTMQSSITSVRGDMVFPHGVGRVGPVLGWPARTSGGRLTWLWSVGAWLHAGCVAGVWEALAAALLPVATTHADDTSSGFAAWVLLCFVGLCCVGRVFE